MRLFQWLFLLLLVAVVGSCLEYSKEPALTEPSVKEVPEQGEPEVRRELRSREKEGASIPPNRRPTALKEEEEPRLFFFGAPVR